MESVDCIFASESSCSVVSATGNPIDDRSTPSLNTDIKTFSSYVEHE